MTKKKTMPEILNGAITRILEAVGARDRALAAYARDPDYRAEDQARRRGEIHESAQSAITAAAGDVHAEIARIGKAYERERKTSYNETAVAESARRFRELRAAGLGVDEILDPSRGLLSRDMAEAVRREIRVDLSVVMKGATADETERRARAIEDAALTAEIAFMDPVERSATEAELGARAGRSAVESLSRFMASPRDAQATIRLGLDLADAGFVPPEPPVDRDRQAERERNSLPPELRAKLDGNVAQPSEPMLRIPGGAG